MSQQQPQWQPTNPPVPPVQKSWLARHKILSVVMGIVLLVVVICCGAGIASMGGDDSSTGASTATSEGSQESADATEEPPAEETEEAPAEESPVQEKSEPAMTTEQENAVGSAESYLQFAPFSKQGLIDQLSSPAGDGYPKDVAQFAVEHIESDVDWNEQAAKAAQNYLDFMSFSRSGLIQQLTSDAGDGYTQEQAEYAADQVGL